MLNCPRCSSADRVKNGAIKDRQGYKCQACQYFYTVHQKSDTATPDQHRLALNLYVEGLGFRSMSRILGFSHVAIYKLIKLSGKTWPRSSTSMNCIAYVEY